MKTKYILVLFIIVSFLSACAGATPTATEIPPGSNTPTPPVSNTPLPSPTSGATAVPTQVSPSAAEQAAIQYVSTKYNIPADQLTILSTAPMTWPNGCMGVVIPGVMCTEMVVDGFIIKLEGNGQQFEIHTNQDGSSVIDAAQQLATLKFVVLGSDQSIKLVDPNIPLGATYNPAFTGFLPTGGSANETAYVLGISQSKAVAVDANGQRDLSFIQNPTYGLAVWAGGEGAQPMLAWGTQLYPDNSSSLMIAHPDGSNLETLVTITPTTSAAVQLVAELWSADGQSVYFSKEPVGLGGYITFSGASNLYKVDIQTKEVTEIIPQTSSTGSQTCLDAISGDYRYVADACAQNEITVRDLQSGSTTTIQAPSDVSGYKLVGSARFSPSGSQVAFALAKHNPDDEQGWVAVGSTTGGTAKLVLTGEAGFFYNVVGWLDDNTLLVQSYSVNNPNAANQLVIVGSDGSNPTKVADGSLLAIIDNR